MSIFSTRLGMLGGRAVVVAAPLVLLSCSHHHPVPQTAASQPFGPRNSPTPVKQPQASAKQPSNGGYLGLSKNVQTRCALPDTRQGSPQFDFDDSALRDRGMKILDGVAKCMLKGSLKNESISVVGHCDPRGTDHYNMDLGMRRADSTRDYLVTRGVSSARIDTESRGKRDAQGTDPATWQLDRRVEIDEYHSPQALR